MGITVIGRNREELLHLITFAKENINNVKKFLVIYLVSSEQDEDDALKEVEEDIKIASGEVPCEIKTFTGSPDTALETFLAQKEHIRMVFLHIKKRDVREILQEEEYTAILRKLQKGVVKTPVVFVPHS